jgi:hypothetical protein
MNQSALYDHAALATAVTHPAGADTQAPEFKSIADRKVTPIKDRRRSSSAPGSKRRRGRTTTEQEPFWTYRV